MKKSASEETAAKEIAAEETTVKDTDKEKMGWIYFWKIKKHIYLQIFKTYGLI